MKSRSTKRNHQNVLAGLVRVNFQSPTIIARLGGRKEMTREEYITHRIHGHRAEWIARELLNGQRRYRRRPVRVA